MKLPQFLRRATNFFVWFFLIVAFIGGCTAIKRGFTSQEVVQEYDFTPAIALAEKVAVGYLTLDENSERRTEKLKSMGQKLTMYPVTMPLGITQEVNHAQALKPTKDGVRITVPVETWTTMKRIDEEGKEKVTARHFLVTVHIQENKNGELYLQGIPSVRLSSLGEEDPEYEDRGMANIITEIEPVLKNFFRAYFEDQDDRQIRSFITTDATIFPLNDGVYTFVDIRQLKLKQVSEGEYSVEADVEVKDKLLETSMFIRVDLELIKQEERYYVKKIK